MSAQVATLQDTVVTERTALATAEAAGQEQYKCQQTEHATRETELSSQIAQHTAEVEDLTALSYTSDAFFILDMPGMILITLLIVILSYVPYLQYLALIPLALGCLVLSIETPQSFLFYFGIVLGVFILASLVEELILTPRIMERNIGMNPVIMVLAVSVWSYLLGMPGTLIGIPLTSLLIIYTKRMLLPVLNENSTN